MNTSKSTFVIAFLTSIILAGCGGSGSTESTESTETAAIESTEEVVSDTAYLVIEGNDLMQFNLDKLEVTEGQTVKLTLKHVGQMSVEAMGHNWVLLQSGTDKTAFGMAAVSARETAYIPEDMKESVIANTDVIGGGEETTIVFDAPKMGYYDFICSFPGHWGVMQGTFVVQPS